MNQEVVRIFDPEVVARVMDWIDRERSQGARLFILEGPPHSGKSTVLKALRAAGNSGIELDDFLKQPVSEAVSWIDQVVAGGARTELRRALESQDLVVVEGAAVWPVIQPLVDGLASGDFRRIYLKEMSATGDYVTWDWPHIWRDLPATTAYWRSIQDHHRQDEPWLTAQLVIERLSGVSSSEDAPAE